MPVWADTRAAAFPSGDALGSAICPIVYPLDQTPSARGFHYTFYGNGFFINSEGYLLTAAHVLSELHDMPPYVVLRLPLAPPRLLKSEVVAVDRDHDIALLRAIPNPFEGKYQVRFLPLAPHWPAPSEQVQAAALRPSRMGDPHTFDAFNEDRPAGSVLGYEFLPLEKGRPETELLLFGHEVLLGDSGAPVVSADSQAVVGLVEGRWLRTNAAWIAAMTKRSTNGVGAVVPIHYAISLLRRQGVAWHMDQENRPGVGSEKVSEGDTSPVAPLSLVAAPFPRQVLEGGEVVLDARVAQNGHLTDIRVVRGGPPFIDPVLSTVDTWSFLPARVKGEATPSRIGIVFQFASPRSLPGSLSVHGYNRPGPDTEERAARPLVTTEPKTAARSDAEVSVILSIPIDERGEAGPIDVLEDRASLGGPIVASVRQWQFVPGQHAGRSCDSTVIVVIRQRRDTKPSSPESGGVAGVRLP